jgi:transcriptional regulator with XRE-family HTH domain
MARQKIKLASAGIAGRLKRVRKDLGLSQRRVSELAELSPSAAQMVEEGGRFPHIDTIEKLAHALRVSKCWFAFGEDPMSEEYRWWIDPAFDPIKMHDDLREMIQHGEGGHIEQSAKYLDAEGASNWLSFVRQADYAASIDSMPLRDIATPIYDLSEGQAIDIIGLGCGTAVHEVRLVNQLLSQGQQSIRMFLLDISQPLLAIGYKHACEQLESNGNVSVRALQGDFHRLASYGDQLRSADHRLRVFCMFGYTFGNLANEVLFLRNSLSLAKEGDLLLLDITTVRAPANESAQVVASEPALSGKRPPEFQRRSERFTTEPIRRHLPEAELRVQARLNTAVCTIPGSYSIDMVAKLPNGRQFSVAYAKRYDLDRLAERMSSEGWALRQSWRYSGDFDFSQLVLFQCEKRRK